MNLNETTLKDWYLVTLHDAPPPKNRVMWGTIASDPSCRWYPGDWCCTSPVLRITNDGVHITKNTRYQAQGPGQEIQLPVKALIKLRQGISPAEYQIMSANPELTLAAARQIIESQRDIQAGNVEPYKIQLSAEDYERFVAVLENPPNPPEKLKKLMQSERLKEHTLLHGLTPKTAHADEAFEPTAKELGANDESR